MNILVLCTGNSARSILLEALLNDLGRGRVRAYSAGSRPAGRVHPQSLALLEAKGHDTSHARSKSWDVFAEANAPEMDMVITVCGEADREPCPLWPEAPLRAHWGVEDPAALPEAAQAEGFAATYDRLRGKAEAFLAMPVETMETGELKALLARIGRA